MNPCWVLLIWLEICPSKPSDPRQALTLIFLPALAVLAPVRGCVQAAAEGGLALIITVAEGLTRHRHSTGDGCWQGRVLRVRVRVTVLRKKGRLFPLLCFCPTPTLSQWVNC